MLELFDNLIANPLLGIGTVLFGVGIVFAAACGMSFRLRAVLNKPAWNGPTLPLLVLALVTLIPGLALMSLYVATM